MTFLKKLSPRAAVSKKYSGQITVWLALSFLVFLSFYFVCLQSVWKQYQRKQAEQAAEAGMFSLFSEYEPHLLKKYDLFCLDTSFGGGVERTDELCSHLWKFTEQNITDASGGPLYGLNLQGVNIERMVRLTDGFGASFFHQAVEVMKEKTGVSAADDWILEDLLQRQGDAEGDTERFQEDCNEYEGSVRDYEEEDDEEDDEEEDQSMDPQARQWDGLWNEFTLEKAVPGDFPVSEKTVVSETPPSQRELSVGAGKTAETTEQILQKPWLIRYLCEYMSHAQEMLPERREEGWLDYQLEYIIAGKTSDSENLSSVIGRLLLIREGANYIFLLTHPELKEKAEALALVLAGMTGNIGLVKSLEQLILLGWAYGESVVEVRQLLGGSELVLMKGTENWQVPLSGLLPALNDPGRYDVQVHRQEGIDYETYLSLFLMAGSAEDLCMRALDVIEGEVSRMEGCQNLHLDHCVDFITAQIWMENIYLERSYGYE